MFDLLLLYWLVCITHVVCDTATTEIVTKISFIHNFFQLNEMRAHSKRLVINFLFVKWWIANITDRIASRNARKEWKYHFYFAN